MAIGSAVTKFKVGDVAGVGCLVDACRNCENCKEGDENYCSGAGGFHGTYGSKRPESLHPGGVTMGGYSSDIVVDENFVLHIPANLNCAAAAPLLCAGITCFSPFKHYGLKAGQTIGVVGCGGLGHMAVKIAKAMGCTVVVVSRSAGKREEAMKLGADKFLISTNPDEMKEAAQSMHFIYDSIAFEHDMPSLLALLKNSGTLCLVGGVPDPMTGVSPFALIVRRLKIVGSCIGGIAETQEMLDFCGKHNIVADIELIPADPVEVNKAWVRAEKSDVKFRFVIDTAKTMKQTM